MLEQHSRPLGLPTQTRFLPMPKVRCSVLLNDRIFTGEKRDEGNHLDHGRRCDRRAGLRCDLRHNRIDCGSLQSGFRARLRCRTGSWTVGRSAYSNGAARPTAA